MSDEVKEVVIQVTSTHLLLLYTCIGLVMKVFEISPVPVQSTRRTLACPAVCLSEAELTEREVVTPSLHPSNFI